MKNRRLVEITFGRDGNAQPHMLYGWSIGEDGYTWTDGSEAALLFPQRWEAPHGIAVELTGDACQGQRCIEVCLNGRPIGGAIQITRGTYAWVARPVNAQDRAIVVTLRKSGVIPPITAVDRRQLGIATRRLRLFAIDETAEAASFVRRKENILSEAELAMEFVSLGDDCELGLVQRKMGAEPLSLLRFSGAPLRHVLRGVDTDWAELGAALMLDKEEKEWMTRERGYDLRWHTFISPDAIGMEAMLEKERRKTGFLRQKLIEDMRSGERIFVVKSRDTPACGQEIMALHLALNRIAPNWLLWLNEGGEIGAAAVIAPRLIRANISRFMRHGIEDDSEVAEWASVMRAAWDLTRCPDDCAMAPNGPLVHQKA